MKKHKTKTFLEEYQRIIWPCLAEIDIFLKTEEFPLDINQAANLLDIEESEIISILKRKNYKTIDKKAFLAIMAAGSSLICRLYAREVEIGSPYTYTADQLSYIYNLDINKVEKACKKLQIKEATALTMPLIFANIPCAEIS